MNTALRRLAPVLLLGFSSAAAAQEFAPPDRDHPVGDAMIQEHLARETQRIESRFHQEIESLADWQRLCQSEHSTQ